MHAADALFSKLLLSFSFAVGVNDSQFV